MTRRVPLSRGLFALVDDADYSRVIAAGPWCAVPQGDTFYAKAHAKTPEGRETTIHLHRFVLDVTERRKVVDHKDRDGLNNQRSNLRITDQARNIANSKLRVDSTSGFKGVSLNKRNQRWVARISVARKNIHLGTYSTPEEAARAYDAAAIKTWGEFARTNFPPATEEKAA